MTSMQPAPHPTHKRHPLARKGRQLFRLAGMRNSYGIEQFNLISDERQIELDPYK